jgi:hypothetical protein
VYIEHNYELNASEQKQYNQIVTYFKLAWSGKDPITGKLKPKPITMRGTPAPKVSTDAAIRRILQLRQLCCHHTLATALDGMEDEAAGSTIGAVSVGDCAATTSITVGTSSAAVHKHPAAGGEQEPVVAEDEDDALTQSLSKLAVHSSIKTSTEVVPADPADDLLVGSSFVRIGVCAIIAGM